ncbi:MAG: PqqD family protein [Treponema sp.]|jgi:FPC/CPF motif-containing protein YcgG|nr:PqqD family protein [Treponema sp.]
MFRLNDTVFFETDNETGKKYLIDSENGNLFHLNETAALLLGFLQDNKDIDKYAAFVVSHAGSAIPLQTIRKDAEAYITLLLDKGFLLREETP